LFACEHARSELAHIDTFAARPERQMDPNFPEFTATGAAQVDAAAPNSGDSQAGLFTALGLSAPANSWWIMLAVKFALAGWSVALIVGYVYNAQARRVRQAAAASATPEAAGTRRRNAAEEHAGTTMSEDAPFLYRLARASEPARDEVGRPEVVTEGCRLGTVGWEAQEAARDLGCVDGAYRGVVGLDDRFIHLSDEAQARRARRLGLGTHIRLSHAAGAEHGGAVLRRST